MLAVVATPTPGLPKRKVQQIQVPSVRNGRGGSPPMQLRRHVQAGVHRRRQEIRTGSFRQHNETVHVSDKVWKVAARHGNGKGDTFDVLSRAYWDADENCTGSHACWRASDLHVAVSGCSKQDDKSVMIDRTAAYLRQRAWEWYASESAYDRSYRAPPSTALRSCWRTMELMPFPFRSRRRSLLAVMCRRTSLAGPTVSPGWRLVTTCGGSTFVWRVSRTSMSILRSSKSHKHRYGLDACRWTGARKQRGRNESPGRPITTGNCGGPARSRKAAVVRRPDTR